MKKTRAVRKGGLLLRGKVSQGRPHPLSIALRCECQTLEKEKNGWAMAQRFLSFLAERYYDVGTTLYVV